MHAAIQYIYMLCLSLSEGSPAWALGMWNVGWEEGSWKMKQNLGPLEITKGGWWASSGGLQALRVGLSPRDQLHRGPGCDKERSSKGALFSIHRTMLISESRSWNEATLLH